MSSKRLREAISSTSSASSLSPNDKNLKMDEEVIRTTSDNNDEEDPTLALIYKTLMEL